MRKGREFRSTKFDSKTIRRVLDTFVSEVKEEDRKKLKARFSRRSQWLGCWSEADCRRLRRRGW